jgi:hypothetical protein
MSKSNENNPHTMVLDVGDVTAGAAQTVTHMQPAKKYIVTKVKMMNNAAIAGHGTNHATVILKKKGGATLATWTSNSGDATNFQALVQAEYKNMVLGAASALEVAATDNLQVDVAHGGSGQALTGAKVELVGYYA